MVILAKAGSRVIGIVTAIIVAFLILYGGYSMWDTYMKMNGAFVSNELLRFKPQPGDVPANESLGDLMAINPDVRGWITIDDTHIDYPVVQGKDDMEYVNKDVYKMFSLSGSIFLSCLNSPDFSDHYNLVYGHHMDNGAMFGDLICFLDKDYFENHKTGTLYLRGATYHISIFSIVDTDAYDHVYRVEEANRGGLAEMLQHIKGVSAHYRDVGVGADDQIIALSTCQTADTNGRTLLFGKMEPIGFMEHGVIVNDDDTSEGAIPSEKTIDTGRIMWRTISRITALVFLGILALIIFLYIWRKVHDREKEEL